MRNTISFIFILSLVYGLLLESVGKYLATFVGFGYALHIPGPNILGVPFIAIIGWGFCICIALSISTYMFEHQTFTLGLLTKMSLLDAFILTILDFALEPSAVQLGWWQYFSEGKFYAVPVLNTLAWVFVVFLFSFLVRLFLKQRKKKLMIPHRLFIFSLTSYFIFAAITLGLAIYFGFYTIAFLAFVGWGIVYIFYTRES